MAKKSPTERTSEYLKKRGCVVRVTERWVKTRDGGFRKDLFGGDMLAVVGPDLLNIQATTLNNMQARVLKCLANPDVKIWLSTGNRFHVWGWQKYPHTNKSGAVSTVGRWRPTVLQLSLEAGEIVTRSFELCRD